MKLQNIMRTQLVIAGLAIVLLVIAVLATVLLFPGVTKAQEISNTAFDVLSACATRTMARNSMPNYRAHHG